MSGYTIVLWYVVQDLPWDHIIGYSIVDRLLSIAGLFLPSVVNAKVVTGAADTSFEIYSS